MNHFFKILFTKVFLIFSILLQNHCLLNPIVREILNLDLNKKGNNLLISLVAFNLNLNRSVPIATVTPSSGNIILSNSTLKVNFSKSMEPSSLSATLGTTLNASWSQTSFPNDTVLLTGTFPLGTNNFVLDAKDSLGIGLTQVNGTYLVLNSNTKIYYVSPTGNDANDGITLALPKN